MDTRHNDLALRNKFTYKSVERMCTKSPCKNLLLHRRCYLPIFVQECHWVGCVIDNDKQVIGLFNPSGKDGVNSEVLQNMHKLVEAEYERLGLEDKSRINLDDWRLEDISPKHKYKQLNGYDCGIFTLLFMSFHSQDLPHDFTQDYIYTHCGGRGARGKLAHLLWKESDEHVKPCLQHSQHS